MIILMLLLLAAIFAISGAVGYYIMQPSAAAARERRRSSTVFLVDLFALSVTLAIPLVAGTALRQSEDPAFNTLAGAFHIIFPVLFASVWWRGVVTLSSIGVTNAWKRGVYLSLVMPFAIWLAAIGVPMLIFATINLGDLPAERRWAFIFCWIATSFLVKLFRSVNEWVIADAKPFTEKQNIARPAV